MQQLIVLGLLVGSVLVSSAPHPRSGRQYTSYGNGYSSTRYSPSSYISRSSYSGSGGSLSFSPYSDDSYSDSSYSPSLSGSGITFNNGGKIQSSSSTYSLNTGSGSYFGGSVYSGSSSTQSGSLDYPPEATGTSFYDGDTLIINDFTDTYKDNNNGGGGFILSSRSTDNKYPASATGTSYYDGDTLIVNDFTDTYKNVMDIINKYEEDLYDSQGQESEAIASYALPDDDFVASFDEGVVDDLTTDENDSSSSSSSNTDIIFPSEIEPRTISSSYGAPLNNLPLSGSQSFSTYDFSTFTKDVNNDDDSQKTTIIELPPANKITFEDDQIITLEDFNSKVPSDDISTSYTVLDNTSNDNIEDIDFYTAPNAPSENNISLNIEEDQDKNEPNLDNENNISNSYLPNEPTQIIEPEVTYVLPETQYFPPLNEENSVQNSSEPEQIKLEIVENKPETEKPTTDSSIKDSYLPPVQTNPILPDINYGLPDTEYSPPITEIEVTNDQEENLEDELSTPEILKAQKLPVQNKPEISSEEPTIIEPEDDFSVPDTYFPSNNNSNSNSNSSLENYSPPNQEYTAPNPSEDEEIELDILKEPEEEVEVQVIPINEEIDNQYVLVNNITQEEEQPDPELTPCPKDSSCMRWTKCANTGGRFITMCGKRDFFVCCSYTKKEKLTHENQTTTIHHHKENETNKKHYGQKETNKEHHYGTKETNKESHHEHKEHNYGTKESNKETNHEHKEHHYGTKETNKDETQSSNLPHKQVISPHDQASKFPIFGTSLNSPESTSLTPSNLPSIDFVKPESSNTNPDDTKIPSEEDIKPPTDKDSDVKPTHDDVNPIPEKESDKKPLSVDLTLPLENESNKETTNEDTKPIIEEQPELTNSELNPLPEKETDKESVNESSSVQKPSSISNQSPENDSKPLEKPINFGSSGPFFIKPKPKPISTDLMPPVQVISTISNTKPFGGETKPIKGFNNMVGGFANLFGGFKTFASSCPAAMICVEKKFCNLLGEVSQIELKIPEMVRIFNGVPLTNCQLNRRAAKNIQAVCCRDPNYVDPWF